MNKVIITVAIIVSFFAGSFAQNCKDHGTEEINTVYLQQYLKEKMSLDTVRIARVDGYDNQLFIDYKKKDKGTVGSFIAGIANFFGYKKKDKGTVGSFIAGIASIPVDEDNAFSLSLTEAEENAKYTNIPLSQKEKQKSISFCFKNAKYYSSIYIIEKDISFFQGKTQTDGRVSSINDEIE